MDVNQIVAIAVFVVVMFTIMTEKLHRSLAAITGAMIVLALHVMPFDAAMEHIDFNTLGVLLGMMLFVSVVKLSGVFEFLAIKCARLAKGDPWKIMLLFVLLTAVLSAFLDNVTTVLLIGPMTLTVCKLLDVNPIPFFMTEILASNIGGILGVGVDFQCAAVQIVQNGVQTLVNIVHILPGDDALSAQHGRVDKAALNILLDHPRVEADGGVKIVYAAVNGLAGPALPKLGHRFYLLN